MAQIVEAQTYNNMNLKPQDIDHIKRWEYKGTHIIFVMEIISKLRC